MEFPKKYQSRNSTKLFIIFLLAYNVPNYDISLKEFLTYFNLSWHFQEYFRNSFKKCHYFKSLKLTWCGTLNVISKHHKHLNSFAGCINVISTPSWPSYQIRFFSPERNILAEAQDALKNAFLFSGIVPNMECHTP